MELTKQHFLCKLLGHKYTSDIIHIKKVGRRYSINRYAHCKRCNITFKTYFGIYYEETLDKHCVMFADMEERIYEAYEKYRLENS